MVEALIKNTRAAEQSVLAYWKKLRPYYTGDEHNEGHEEAPLWMACLAAFPVAITIDLLYQLWANFRELKDKDGKVYQLPPLVVNDCILSSLFRITGKDIYEMPSDTRAFLLNVFKQVFGDEVIADLASFLYKYIQEKKTNDFPENFYNAQEWTALLAVDPQQAAMNILGTLKAKLEEGQLQSIGVTNLLTTLVKENHNLAEMLRRAIDVKTDSLETAEVISEETIAYGTRKNLNIRPAAAGSGVTIDLPATLSSGLMPLYESGVVETFPVVNGSTNQSTTYALVITNSGVTQFETAYAFSNLLVNKKLVESPNIYTIDKQRAPSNQLIEVLQNILSKAGVDDTIFCYIRQHDYAVEPNNKTYIFDPDNFRALLTQYAINDPSIVLMFDAPNYIRTQWLKDNNSKHIVITSSAEAVLQPNEPTRNLTTTLINLFTTSKQNLTYKEIYAHLLTVEKLLPGFSIQPDYWDNYFLTSIKQSPVLQKQQMLSQLGYSLFVDGKEGQQYQKSLEEFQKRYGILNGNVHKELEHAVLLKDDPQIKLYYFSIHTDLPNAPDQYSPLGKTNRYELIERIEKLFRATVKYEELQHMREANKNLIAESIITSHLVLIGVNRAITDNAERLEELKEFVNIAKALNKCVYFIIEEECNWRQSPVINHTILPNSFQPINQERGMHNLQEELQSILTNLQKYLLPENAPANHGVIEQRIREARKTKHLVLRELSLQEIPAAVFQLDGLISLDLSGNKLTTIPQQITQLQTLRKLDLEANPIEYLPEEIGTLLQLEELTLWETRLQQLPRNIGQLTNLKRLYLQHTGIKIFPVGSFANKFPDLISYEGTNSLNLELTGNLFVSLKDYFAPVHTKEFAILEIHSEHSIPHFNTVPDNVQDKVYYGFHSEVATLQQLFKIIYTEAATKHTIVYLCDEKNILSPQFGAESQRHNLIYQYFQAFGKPLNLIINFPLLYSGTVPDLIGPQELNFAAVRNDKPINGEGFPEMFFRMIWQPADITDLISNIFIATSSVKLQDDVQYLREELTSSGFHISGENILPPGGLLAGQIQKQISSCDLLLIILDDKGVYRNNFLEEQYKAAEQSNKKILIFQHNEPSDPGIPHLSSFLNSLRQKRLIAFYNTQTELAQKVRESITYLQSQKQPDKRMSLANTLKQIQKNDDSYKQKLGYRIYANYSALKDFSFPLPDKKPATQKSSSNKTTNQTNAPASTTVPDKPTHQLKPFNGKYILVIGTGNAAKIIVIQKDCAKRVGTMLAEEGYGLICGGWGGLDKEISKAFEQVYQSNNSSVKSSLIQALNSDQTPFTKGKVERVKRSEWNAYTVGKAFAVIVIGGASLTRTTYEYARQQQVPVIPIQGTLDQADKIYNELEKLSNYLYPKSLLRKLWGYFFNDELQEQVPGHVLAILQHLEKKRAAGNTFKTTVERLYKERKIVVLDDLQKDRWGGRAKNDDKRIQATVEPSKNQGLYKLTILVSGKPLTGQVALFMHNSFHEEIQYITANDNLATFETVVYEAFTIGAYTEDGGTMLELDLNKVRGYPTGFYSNDISSDFKKRVEKLYREKPVVMKDDLQNGRWGGEKMIGGLELSAKVSKAAFPDSFNVVINLSAVSLRPFNGEVAFFLHNTFPNEIRYAKTARKQATIALVAYEAFTVGAYTYDGYSLELDLQEQKGYPAAFYYKEEENKPRPKQLGKSGKVQHAKKASKPVKPKKKATKKKAVKKIIKKKK